MGNEWSYGVDESCPYEHRTEWTIFDAAKLIEKTSNVVVLAGPGISTGSGLPDFRHPAYLRTFDIDLIKFQPEPFLRFMREYYCYDFKPSLCHYFIKMLHVHGKLQTYYTQSADGLDRKLNLPPPKLVELNGSFESLHCLKCGAIHTRQWAHEILKVGSPYCARCAASGRYNLVIPDLRSKSQWMKHFNAIRDDISQCHTLIVMGCSLHDPDLRRLISYTNLGAPRIFIDNTGNASIRCRPNDVIFDVKKSALDACMAIVGILGWSEKILSFGVDIFSPFCNIRIVDRDKPRSDAEMISTGTLTVPPMPPVGHLENPDNMLGMLANAIKKSWRIIAFIGPGISREVGIPDFRSPAANLGDILRRYRLPHMEDPSDIFKADYFKRNPEPFYHLAKQILPAELKPSLSHFFLALLERHNHLLRVYTQNVDTLEHVAGIAAGKIVETHGTLRTSHCTECRKEFTLNELRARILFNASQPVPPVPFCDYCIIDGKHCAIKPDVCMFGEDLPDVHLIHPKDFAQCDLLLVIGSSLNVHPFTSLIARIEAPIPRFFIHDEAIYHHFDDTRDYICYGNPNEALVKVAKLLGWSEELARAANLASGTVRPPPAANSPKPKPKFPPAEQPLAQQSPPKSTATTGPTKSIGETKQEEKPTPVPERKRLPAAVEKTKEDRLPAAVEKTKDDQVLRETWRLEMTSVHSEEFLERVPEAKESKHKHRHRRSSPRPRAASSDRHKSKERQRGSRPAV